MLVLSRKIGQQIRIGDQITLTVVKSKGNTVRIGIEAPKDVRVVRAELPRFESLPSDGDTSAAAPRQESSELPAPVGTLRLLDERADRRRVGDQGRSGRAFSAGTPASDISRHPERWSVASMRDRVQSALAARTTDPADALR